MKNQTTKEVLFQEKSVLCCQQPEHPWDWGISGGFHIWQPNTAEVFSSLIYIILALTFGYTMIMAETSLGRMTKKVR